MPSFVVEDNVDEDILKYIKVRPGCTAERFPQGMRQNTPDPGDHDVREYANRRNSILVACDPDFLDVTNPHYKLSAHTGTLVLRITPQTARRIMAPLRKLLAAASGELHHAICELYEDNAVLTTLDGRFKLSGSRFKDKMKI